MHCLAGPSQSQRRNQTQREAVAMEKVRQRTVIVAGCLERDHRRRTESAQIVCEAFVILQAIGYAKVPAAPCRPLVVALRAHDTQFDNDRLGVDVIEKAA